MGYRKSTIITIVLLFAIISGCNTNQNKVKHNQLTQVEIDRGWELLFDGKTLDGWRILGRDKDEKSGYWKVEDGAIRKVNNNDVAPPANGKQVNGDLMTIDAYDNFELSYEWKINEAGNSGIKYNVSEELSMKYGSNNHALGFEYQELDDGNAKYQGENKLKPTLYTASLYDMIASQNVQLNPVGQYNNTRIIVNGNHGEHWLNEVKVLEYEFGTAKFDSLYNLSKYHEYPDFEKKRKGHIVITNHHDDSWHRNIKIRKLTSTND